MASNTTTSSSVSSSPSCVLVPQEPILPWISDNVLAIVLPTIVYAVAGGFFHVLDTFDLFSDYRIHPSEDELKRNHVTRWECLRGVARYHVMAISIGLLLNHGNGPSMVGDESCKIQQAATAIRNARDLIPLLLNTIGIDAKQLSHVVRGSSTALAHFIGGASYVPIPDATFHDRSHSNGFTALELTLAKLFIRILRPAVQYLGALVVVDTWIYFTHRLCHVNRTLYRLVHAQHHRIYVSYAYGAVYAHWLESLFLDILSFVLAGEIAQLTPRQSMLFGSAATVKTISDHCGYVFPWDPFGWVNGNGAGFHDLHHQSWGLKYNYSTYTVFWDNLLGTTWADKQGAEKRYRRVRDLTREKAGLPRAAAEPLTDKALERDAAERKTEG
ncbi:MAG: hypothetical protein LQ338_005272 [Usnochroma carphineum]|nr:MAG: hypothetical protein LQ338_005272 [Usnochroma carphineum]